MPIEIIRDNCEAPVTARVEQYTPRDGRAHGDLAGVLHVCEYHRADAAEGYSATYSTASADGARCGDGMRFA